MKRRTKIERKTMIVEGGEAWVEVTRWTKRKPIRQKFLQHDIDGVDRMNKRVFFSKGTTTGECPECKKFPCPHTAKLLG